MKILYSMILVFFCLRISLYSQNVKTVYVDSLLKWTYTGETPDIKLTNHGNSVVYYYEGKILEYSIQSKKNLREIPIHYDQSISNISIDKNSKYIMYEVKADSTTKIADYNTGKILKTLKGRYCLSEDYLFYYKDILYSDKMIFYRLNLNDFDKVEMFSLAVPDYSGENHKFNRMRTIQGTNFLLVSIGGILYYRGDIIQLPNIWTIIDFDNKSSKQLPIYVDKKTYPNDESDLIMTKNMKYYAIGYHFYTFLENNNGSIYNDSFITIYDSNSTQIFQIKESDLRVQLGDKLLFILFNIQIINDKYLVFNIKDIYNSKDLNNRLLVYDLEKKELFKIIDYDLKNYDYNYDRLVLISYFGIAKLDLDAVPVEENPKTPENFAISFVDNNLTILADNREEVSLEIYNYYGQKITTLENIVIQKGKNLININEHLTSGMYFCLVKNNDSSIVKKFIVIR